jgi:REP element-mobilizing transposase RayT
MTAHPKLPPRLDRIFPSTPIFFVTFCTYRRRNILAIDSIHAAFREFAIRAYVEHYVAVGRYVIMPDHVHLFVCGPYEFGLGRWVGMLKQYLAKQVGRIVAPPVWQRGFFDHLLRSDESYEQKWNYVRENPIRAGLAKSADDWRYAGEIIVIDRVKF